MGSKIQLEQENKQRDADFNKAMHGKTAAQANGIATILFKNPEAKKAALDEYFKHFEGKRAEDETEADRKVRALPNPRRAAVKLSVEKELELTVFRDRHEPTSMPL